jgi:hypothetical protein
VPIRAVVIAGLVAAVGGLAFFVLGQLAVRPGLVAVAAFTGWMTAIALVDIGGAATPGRARVAVAVTLAAGGIIAALALDWAWAGMEGGVLDPVTYVAQLYGPAALLDVAVAGVLATLHAR